MVASGNAVVQMRRNVMLLLLGVALLVWGHYSNEQYKEKHGIDATSGETELAD